MRYDKGKIEKLTLDPSLAKRGTYHTPSLLKRKG
jgi:hypothetical protein